MSNNHTIDQRIEWTEWHHTRGHHLHIAKHENGEILEGSTHYLRNTKDGQRSSTIAAIQTTETDGRSDVFAMDAAETEYIGEGEQKNVDQLNDWWDERF